MCTRGAQTLCGEEEDRRAVGVSLYHSLASSFQTGSLTGPETGLATRQLQGSPSLPVSTPTALGLQPHAHGHTQLLP